MELLSFCLDENAGTNIQFLPNVISFLFLFVAIEEYATSCSNCGNILMMPDDDIRASETTDTFP